MTSINLALLKPDILAMIAADLEQAGSNGWAKSRELQALDDAKVALAENVGMNDADMMIAQAVAR